MAFSSSVKILLLGFIHVYCFSFHSITQWRLNYFGMITLHFHVWNLSVFVWATRHKPISPSVCFNNLFHEVFLAYKDIHFPTNQLGIFMYEILSFVIGAIHHNYIGFYFIGLPSFWNVLRHKNCILKNLSALSGME